MFEVQTRVVIPDGRKGYVKEAVKNDEDNEARYNVGLDEGGSGWYPEHALKTEEKAAGEQAFDAARKKPEDTVSASSFNRG